MNLNKSTYTYQHDWVVNLDLIVLIDKVIDYLTSQIYT
jgi:hypothetical protein